MLVAGIVVLVTVNQNEIAEKRPNPQTTDLEEVGASTSSIILGSKSPSVK